MVCDKDANFTSLFYTELFKLQCTTLAMSIAYHPQPNGQTQVVNRSLDQYLQAFICDRPNQWAEWLSLAKFWFNTNFHTSLKLTPFEALYGFQPPKLQAYIPGTTRVRALDSLLSQRQEVLTTLKGHLLVAKERMKFYADKHRVTRSFQLGDWVYLRLQPYKHRTLAYKGKWKLSPRQFGPFQVAKQIGQVSYKLALPLESKVHPIFHVSYLKLKLGKHVTPLSTLPLVDDTTQLCSEPIAVLQTRTKTLRSCDVTEVLVQWSSSTIEEATWESLHQLQLSCPYLVINVL